MAYQKEKKPLVMIVDDTPANLEVLEEIITRQGYEVVAFPRGDMALRAAEASPPNLILLDIMMPNMDGFEVCIQLKLNPKLKDIPVIFISALQDTENKVKAFSFGGVDYVTKPFQEEEVLARINVHLEIQKQKAEIQKLLSETLVGAIKSLVELLAIADPESYRETLKIAQYIRTFSQKAKLPDSWMYEVASSFLNLGSLFDEDLRRQNLPLKAKPIDLQESILKEVSTIISFIPRMDRVAAIIEKVTTPPNFNIAWRNWPTEMLGGHLIFIAINYERYLEKGFTKSQALQFMMEPSNNGQFDPRLLADFAKVIVYSKSLFPEENILNILDTIEPPVKTDKFDVTLDELAPDQILVEDLVNTKGVVMVSKGTQLTQNLCMQIKNKNNFVPLVFPVKVTWAQQSDLE